MATVAVEAEHIFDQPERRISVMGDSLERVRVVAHAGLGGTRNHHHAGQANHLGETSASSRGPSEIDKHQVERAEARTEQAAQRGAASRSRAAAPH